MKIYKEWLVAFALVLLMVVQKLTDTIDWSWWTITSPIWGLMSVYVLIFVLVVILFQVKKLFKK